MNRKYWQVTFNLGPHLPEIAGAVRPTTVYKPGAAVTRMVTSRELREIPNWLSEGYGGCEVVAVKVAALGKTPEQNPQGR